MKSFIRFFAIVGLLGSLLGVQVSVAGDDMVDDVLATLRANENYLKTKILEFSGVNIDSIRIEKMGTEGSGYAFFIEKKGTYLSHVRFLWVDDENVPDVLDRVVAKVWQDLDEMKHINKNINGSLVSDGPAFGPDTEIGVIASPQYLSVWTEFPVGARSSKTVGDTTIQTQWFKTAVVVDSALMGSFTEVAQIETSIWSAEATTAKNSEMIRLGTVRFVARKDNESNMKDAVELELMSATGMTTLQTGWESLKLYAGFNAALAYRLLQESSFKGQQIADLSVEAGIILGSRVSVGGSLASKFIEGSGTQNTITPFKIAINVDGGFELNAGMSFVSFSNGGPDKYYLQVPGVKVFIGFSGSI